MNPMVQFLTALGQTFAAITLYADGHPMRQSAIARLLASIQGALADGASLRLSFIDGDVIAGGRPVSELRGWDWGGKLSAGGIQRLEIAAAPSPDDVDAMLSEMRARMAAPSDPPRQFAAGPIRLGPLTVATSRSRGKVASEPNVDSTRITGLAPEMAATAYVHREIAAGHNLPAAELDAVVHALAITVRREQRSAVLPLLDLREFGDYPATHACNVAMLAIRLSDALELPDTDARAIGAAALLHDVGNECLPPELLTKAGSLTDEERALIHTHPIKGARLLSARGNGHALAATVAYEHHIWFNGRGGYPDMTFPRATHYASRIVRVCDIYDALCSRRPYRDSWPRALALDLIKTIAGVELDPTIAATFVRMAAATTEQRSQASHAAA